MADLSSTAPLPGDGSSHFILARGLSKYYKAPDRIVEVLKDADLELAAGSFSALVGRSGTGKTTVLNLLGGLDRPTSGRLSVGGRGLDQLSDKELSQFRNETVGFIFQSFFLRPLRTALENVMVPLMFGTMDVASARRRAREVLTEVGLGLLIESPVSQLSGGQRQRVAVARAVANRPKLLLADEPTGSLDTETSLEIFQLLHKYNQEHGTSIVIVTHDPLVERFQVPMYTLEKGRIVPYTGSIG